MNTTYRFDTFAEARRHALALAQGGHLKRVENRRWSGNGMGYSPASYVLVDRNGIEMARVWSSGYGWNVSTGDGILVRERLTAASERMARELARPDD
jgi:hypothetical protein